MSCLNLPAGAACSYAASSGTLSITTTSATPDGTYLITAVFTETLPGAAALILLPFLLAPLAGRSNRKALRIIVATVAMFIVAVVAAGSGCGGGGGGGGTTPPPASHQATSSGTVTLVVH